MNDTCTISLDATCTPLHRRGYRLDGRKAPLREDLAHALVLASGFAPGEALLDPFCGSGTIAIEAASIARCLARQADCVRQRCNTARGLSTRPGEACSKR